MTAQSGNIPTTFTRLQAGTIWNAASQNMGDVELSQRGLVAYTDTSQKALMFLPGSAQITTIHVDVTTSFNATTSNLLYVGLSGSVVSGAAGQGYLVSGANGSSFGRVTLGTSANYSNWSSVGSSNIIVTGTFSGTGTAASAGVAQITVVYAMKG